MLMFFFFKQNTAYEMRISDWSSDVCSSDLVAVLFSCWHDDKTMDESDGRTRKIIHIDMDAFFASVEQRENPELRGKPVAVGGSSARGVVEAASSEDRPFGVRSAMPYVTAKRKCPDLILVPARFDVYRPVSR